MSGLSQRRSPRLVIKNAHPLVVWLFDEMYSQQIGIVEMAHRSGVSQNALTDWRSRTSPNLPNLEACCNVLGYTLIPVEITDEEETKAESDSASSS